MLQVSPTTVYRHIQAEKLAAVKPCAEPSRSIGHRQIRIKQEDLDAYIEAHRVTSTAPLDRPFGELRRDLGRGLSAGVGESAGQNPVDAEPDHNAHTETTKQQSEIRNGVSHAL